MVKQNEPGLLDNNEKILNYVITNIQDLQIKDMDNMKDDIQNINDSDLIIKKYFVDKCYFFLTDYILLWNIFMEAETDINNITKENFLKFISSSINEKILPN